MLLNCVSDVNPKYSNISNIWEFQIIQLLGKCNLYNFRKKCKRIQFNIKCRKYIIRLWITYIISFGRSVSIEISIVAFK